MTKDQKRYRYETHLHTAPVSKCARASVRETIECYKNMEYAGVFITNHFIDGNINIDRALSYEERIRFYFSDYEEAVKVGKELDFQVFCGVEMSYLGTDFLIYGLDKEWFLSHPEIEEMKKTKQLTLMAEQGALIIQAHPFREADYIDHIRLFPRHIHGVEVYNGCRNDFENRMAQMFAQNYDLIPFAGTDNHIANKQMHFGGMQSDRPIVDELDFVEQVRNGEMTPFRYSKPIIIYDTDMDTDCDDAGAFAMLAQAHMAGRIKLAGIVADSVSPHAAPCCEVMAGYYDLNLPIGAVQVQEYLSGEDAEVRFGEYCGHSEGCIHRGMAYNLTLGEKLGKTDRDYLSAAALYRKVLAAAADGSVTVLCVGMLTAVAEALASGPDQFSPDTGVELFRKKVKQVVTMGTPDKSPDFNWGMDAHGAAQFFALCPVPVKISPDGGEVIVGADFSDRMPQEHPVRQAYEQWLGGAFKGRSSWDLIAALYAIDPDTPYLNSTELGRGYYEESTKRFLPQDTRGPECMALHVNATDQEMAKVLTEYVFGQYAK